MLNVVNSSFYTPYKISTNPLKLKIEFKAPKILNYFLKSHQIVFVLISNLIK